METNEKSTEKTNIETLLAAVDQQLLVRLLESLVSEQTPLTLQATERPEQGGSK